MRVVNLWFWPITRWLKLTRSSKVSHRRWVLKTFFGVIGKLQLYFNDISENLV